MSQVFQHGRTLWADDHSGLSPLRDLSLRDGAQDGGAGVVFHALAGPFPGLQASAWSGTGQAPVDIAFEPGPGQVGITPQLVQAETAGGRDMVLMTGSGNTGLTGYWLDGAGQFSQRFLPDSDGTVPADLHSVIVHAQSGTTHVYGLGGGDRRPMHWEMDETGTMTQRHPGSDAAGGMGPTDLAITGNWLVTGGGGEMLELYEIRGNGTLAHRAMLAEEDNPGMSGAVVLHAVTLGGVDYVIAGAASSGSLSVFRIDAQGHFETVDHIVDDRDSRFGGVTELAVVETGGRVHIAAGGGDSGVSLLELLPGGTLLHKGVQYDTLEVSMDGLVALDMVADADGGLTLATTGQRDPGVSLFHHEIDQNGIVAMASDRDSVVRGGGGDDILVDGAGADRMWGGAGADTFVMGADGQRDIITGFDPTEDRLDLSGWALLHSASQLDIVSRADGAVVSYSGFLETETLVILSQSGQSLSVAQIEASIQQGPSRYLSEWFEDVPAASASDGDEPVITPITTTASSTTGSTGGSSAGSSGGTTGGTTGDTTGGTTGGTTGSGGQGGTTTQSSTTNTTTQTPSGPSTADIMTPQYLSGSTGNDTIEGGGANDTVIGMAGSDRMTGGAGDDLLLGGIGFDTGLGNTGNDTLRGLDGWDELSGGDGDDELYGNNGNDTLTGGDGDDRIYGGIGTDHLVGGTGRDVIRGDPGRDSLEGGGSDDHLLGNAGPDTLLGGWGADTLEGGINNDVLDGGTGNDLLYGNNGSDVISGGGGNDTIYGNAGADRIDGGGGDDVVNGGVGGDSFVFHGQGTLRIEDFQDNIDTLILDDALWGGGARSASQILSQGAVEDGMVVLSFGAQGRVEIDGLDMLNLLANDIEII